MQVSVHEIEDKVNVPVVFCSDHVLQSDDVLVAGKLLQENYLSKRSLRISCVLECVKVLFQGYDLFGPLVDRFPNDAIGTLTYTQKTFLEAWTKGADFLFSRHLQVSRWKCYLPSF